VSAQQFSKLYNNPQIKAELQALRQDNNEIEEREISTRSFVLQKRETQKSRLLKIGNILEEVYIKEELEFMIPSISETVISLLEREALEGLITYAIETLPEKYKQSEKSRAPKIQSQNVLNHLKEETEKNIENNLQHLDSEDDLKAAYELKLQELKKIEEVAEKKNHSLLPDEREDGHYNQLNELDRLQEERFAEKASCAPPLEAIDITEANIQRLREKGQEWVDAIHDTIKYFTDEYPPRTQETCDGIIESIDIYIKGLRPFSDLKYRRDWPMWCQIIEKKINVSATNASKISAIEAAYRVDPRTGKPLMRHITKEQIDSMYEEHLNFLVKYYNNDKTNFLYWMSRAFRENGAPARESRAIDLGPKLSHLS
jgi:hypothetical protein